MDIKKIDPKVLSAKVKVEFMYSLICNDLKYIPNIIVTRRAILAIIRFPSCRL